MNEEFIEFHHFVEDFFNLELELEIDEILEKMPKSYFDSHNLKLRFSNIHNLKYLSLHCSGTIGLLSPEQSAFQQFQNKEEKIFCRFLKFLKFLNLSYDQKSHFTRRIKSTP